MIKKFIFFISVSFLPLSSSVMKPVAWSEGEPIWQEGEPLPPEGKSWIVLCARKHGLIERNPSEDTVFRPKESLAGHAWLERLRSDGMLSSMSTHIEPRTQNVADEDWLIYKFDKDTFRLAYLVPDSLADQVIVTAETYAKNAYNLFQHNCVHTTAQGACAAGLDGFFEKIFPSFSEEGPAFEKGHITTPSALYSALQSKVGELEGWNHPILNPSKEIKNQVVWVYLASEDPYAPSFFHPPASLQLEKDYMIAMLPTRGNFGGICLSRRAEFCLRLEDIHGAIFDETTQQIILVGKKSLRLPEVKLDDLAVAVHSIYGLKGNQPEDPGVSIDPGEGDQMVVRFFGETRNTGFGKALFEADYALKMLSIGEYPCHVPGFISFLDRAWLYQDIIPLLDCNCRTWIIPEKISLEESSDGSSMVFSETKMQCLAQTICTSPASPNVPLEEFARHFTDNYDAISSEYPIFSEMKRLGQITAVVKWLKDHQIPFDYSFFQSYSPLSVATPDSIPTITGRRSDSSSFINLSGGVLFHLGTQNYSSKIDAKIDNFKEKVIAARPDESTFVWEFENFSAQAFPFVKTQKTEDFRTTFVDIQIAVSEDIPFLLTRYYDSFNDDDVGFGRGWSIAPFHVLTPQIPSEFPYCVIREGNEHWIYRHIGGTRYLREDGQQILVLNKDRTSTLQLKNGTLVYFNPEGKILHLICQTGAFLDYYYEKGALYKIEDQNGKKIQCIRTEDRIVQATGSDGQLFSYQYDLQNLLSVVCDGKGVPRASYRYDQDLRLTEIKGANGETLFRGSYDDYNRLASCRWLTSQSHGVDFSAQDRITRPAF